MPVYFYGDSFGGSAGIEDILTPQNTDAAAAQALEPQSFGDEFNPKTNPDIQVLIARYDVLTKECQMLCDKLYMSKTPLTWMEQDKTREALDVVERELHSVRNQLQTISEGNEPGEPFKGAAEVIDNP